MRDQRGPVSAYLGNVGEKDFANEAFGVRSGRILSRRPENVEVSDDAARRKRAHPPA